MWSYYGAKTNVIDLYPKPVYDTIIEPFAGTARYALKYFEKEVILIDKYPVIVDIWKWMQQCSPNDILSLPRFKPYETLEDYTFDCEAARLFMGFIIGCGAERPRIKSSDRITIQRPNHVNYNLKRIAANLFKIKHWNILHGSYDDIENITASWFIDPPYQFGGDAYVMSNKKICFQNLAEYCKNRNGQVIVCENTKADWMDFVPVKMQRGSLFSTTEAIWTNFHTHYNNVQQKLIL